MAQQGLPPLFEFDPVSQVMTAGGSYELTASAAGAVPMYYQWYLDGSPIPGGISSAYYISNATSANAGTYTVVATNAYGNATSDSAVVTLGSATLPTITQQPASQNVPFGNSFSVGGKRPSRISRISGI
ncbi:MAG TPA: immunoglobulin domain-containing protein [Opitutaceae bacterium]|nr:immunoglobulin domain-containing protein [Opitutaceae bacterium]